MYRSALAFGLLVSPAVAGVAQAADAIPGHVVIARTEPQALVLWDATPEVADIVRSKLSDAEANERLERDALRVFAQTAADLSAAKSVTVRITYSMTGDVSPLYGQATFAGIERYATVRLTGTEITSDRHHWREAAAGTGPLPSEIELQVVGKLPPR